MAYKKNYLDQDNQGQVGATGSGGILAGNSGQGPQQQQNTTGSGWTNLNTYLEMNQGQTDGLANTYAGANQQVVDKAIGSDLVKQTQNDQQWSKPINDAKAMTDQVKSGDLSKVDPNQFKTIQGSSYQKPVNYNQLQGYGDVLGNFSKAAERVDNVQDYGTQQSTLRDEFSKGYQGYNSGMGTLDTFLLRGDKDAAAKTKAWQEANKGYGSLKNPDGTSAGVSERFNTDVTGALNNFFTGQESAFNTAKGEMAGAVGQRRSGIESMVTPEMLKKKESEVKAALRNAARGSQAKAKEQGENFRSTDFSKFGSTQGTLDAADLLSDADYSALSVLEGLDGGRSAIQDQAKDYGYSYDATAADELINQRLSATKAAQVEADNKRAADEAAQRELAQAQAEARKIPVNKPVSDASQASTGAEEYGLNQAWKKVESWFK